MAAHEQYSDSQMVRHSNPQSSHLNHFFNSREEVEKYEKEVHELNAKLRLQNAYNSVDQTTATMASGLCIRCAQNEAVLPESYGSQKQSVDKLTK